MITHDRDFSKRYLKLLNEIFNQYGIYLKYEQVKLVDQDGKDINKDSNDKKDDDSAMLT